jgi:phosphohistidine phosphatase SixA
LKIHLLRHAKTNQISKSGLDFDRELLPKGIKQAELMSDYLKGLDNIDIHCSASKRTMETFEIITKKLKFHSIHFTNELYLCTHLDILKYVNTISSKNDIFLIGHNKGISDFASYLCDEFIDFKTCEYSCFNLDIQSWSEVSAGLAKKTNSYRPDVN